MANGGDGYQISDYEESKVINSVLGSASIGYQRTLFIDLTARNDWSSSLPAENNSYFYPSATASYVFSEVADIEGLSFGKLRLGWAQVGNDTGPYQTGLTCGVNPNFGSSGSASVPNAQNNPDLRPEKTTSFEIGTELNFFADRLRIDATYYNNITEDLIFNVPVSAASGYTSAVLNAGKTQNRGVELAVPGTLIQSDDFTWDLGVNFAKNNNELLELADGVENIRYTSLFGVTLERALDIHSARSTATTSFTTIRATSWLEPTEPTCARQAWCQSATSWPTSPVVFGQTCSTRTFRSVRWSTSRKEVPYTATRTSGASTREPWLKRQKARCVKTV